LLFVFCGRGMPLNKPEIKEAQRLTEQAEAQIATQLAMVERMKRAGFSTEVAEEALRTMREIVAQMHERLRTLTGGKIR
jgi:hypothetical protein